MARERTPLTLVLASGSATRRSMLSSAGLTFEVIPADVDEAKLRDGRKQAEAGVTAMELATTLARAKAEAVSRARPDALVIGSDQLLELDGRIFEKPTDVAAARKALADLRGKTHTLHSAAALATNGLTGWVAMQTTRMTMRDFSEDFLDTYLSRCGSEILSSVGAYQIEGPGVQLFDQVEGDYFNVLGLPLLPLLKELRARGVLMP